jgi:hypothetical protein
LHSPNTLHVSIHAIFISYHISAQNGRGGEKGGYSSIYIIWLQYLIFSVIIEHHAEMGFEIVSRETDRKAVFLTELLQTTRARLLAYARSRNFEGTAAEDLVQEVCLSAWTHIDAVMGSPNPPGWLMNALKRV